MLNAYENYIIYKYMNIVDFYCEKHFVLRDEYPLSPCRYLCKHCGKRKIHGYTNPQHAPNPFGYLYLAPVICTNCSFELNKCMWCKHGDETE